MAGIDKIYINSVDQFKELYNWCKSVKNDCYEKTEYNILGYFYETDENEVIKWFNDVRQSRIEVLKKLTEVVKLPFEDPEFQRNFCKWNNGTEYTPENAIVIQDHVDYINKLILEDPTFANIEIDIPITNFPQAIDRYLIQNCPINFVQERLKDQYEDSYESIKLNRDIYSKPYIYEPCRKLKVVRNSKYFGKSVFKERNWRNRYTKFSKTWEIRIEDPNNECDYAPNWRYNEEKDYWVNNDKELRPYTDASANICKSEKALIRKIFKWKLPKGLIINVTSTRYDDDFKIITK